MCHIVGSAAQRWIWGNTMRQIDADALEVLIKENTNFSSYMDMIEAIHCVNNAPTIDDVWHGKWQNDNPDLLKGPPVWRCSVCDSALNNLPPDYTPKYCPNCGARMDLK